MFDEREGGGSDNLEQRISEEQFRVKRQTSDSQDAVKAVGPPGPVDEGGRVEPAQETPAVSDRHSSATGQVITLVPKAAASKAGPPEDVVDFLTDFLRQVKSGEVVVTEGLIIHYLTPSGPAPDDGCKHRYWRWGMSMMQHLGLLQVAANDLIHKETT